MNRTFILLGGAGYFGYNFYKYLTHIGLKNVIIVDRQEYPQGLTLLTQRSIKAQNNFIKFDLSEDIKPLIEQLKVFKDIVLINFAAESFVDDSLKKPIHTYRNNLNIVINFCELIKELKPVSSIHISTDEVFNRYDKDDVDKSAYSLSKDLAERIIRNTSPNTLILRPSNIYGIYETDKLCIQRKPCVIMNLVNKIYIIANTSVSRNFVHVKNICESLYLMTLNKIKNLDSVEDCIYYYNNDDDLNISDLIKYVANKDNSEYIELFDDPRGLKQDLNYKSFKYLYEDELHEVVKKNKNVVSFAVIYEEILKIRSCLKFHEYD